MRKSLIEQSQFAIAVREEGGDTVKIIQASLMNNDNPSFCQWSQKGVHSNQAEELL